MGSRLSVTPLAAEGLSAIDRGSEAALVRSHLRCSALEDEVKSLKVSRIEFWGSNLWGLHGRATHTVHTNENESRRFYIARTWSLCKAHARKLLQLASHCLRTCFVPATKVFTQASACAVCTLCFKPFHVQEQLLVLASEHPYASIAQSLSEREAALPGARAKLAALQASLDVKDAFISQLQVHFIPSRRPPPCQNLSLPD